MRYATPIKIKRHAESFGIVDANGITLAFVYFTEDESRATTARRLTEGEARKTAQRIARALTEAAASEAV